jgi:hypothetical protein
MARKPSDPARDWFQAFPIRLDRRPVGRRKSRLAAVASPWRAELAEGRAEISDPLLTVG